MRIVLLGSGNVAFHLSAFLTEKKMNVVQLFGRNTETMKTLSEKVGVPYSTSTLADADLYIICVKDDAVEKVSKIITKNDALVVHTSGSLAMEALKGGYRKGCFYPLQTFSVSKNLQVENIPFFIEAEKEKDYQTLEKIGLQLSGKVEKCTFEKRKYIHLTAVFSCNFVNHLFARAKELADKEKISFDYFLPLIEETFDKIKKISPKEAQTGPAVRNDTRILEMHEKLLENESLEIYQSLNKSIKKMYEL